MMWRRDMAEQVVALDVPERAVSPKAETSVERETSLSSVLTVAAVGLFFSVLAVAFAGLTLGE
jgi:type VI protein secretion system component VasF